MYFFFTLVTCTAYSYAKLPLEQSKKYSNTQNPIPEELLVLQALGLCE